MVVDDDPALRTVVSFSLELAGYQVLEADSRQSAIDQLAKNSLSVVILDMGMPPHEHTPEEGLAVLDWLANHQSQAKTIILTGQNAQATSYLALKQGAFDFLEKPVSQEALLMAVRRAVLFYEQAQKLKAQEGRQRVEIETCLGDGMKSVRKVLSDTDFNVHETARQLGIKRENVYYLIKKYGLQRE